MATLPLSVSSFLNAASGRLGELTAQQIRALIAENELMEVNDGEDA